MLVDTNVILDILTNSPWAEWSIGQLAGGTGPRIVDPVVYAELAAGYAMSSDLDAVLDTLELIVQSPPRAALFKAGHAYRAYRMRGGQKTRVLPDFLIGAHADALGVPLLTRNKQDFAALFPDLKLIAPDQV